MAIIDNGQTADQNQTQAQPSTQTGATTGAKWSFHGGAAASPIARNMGGELLKKLQTALTEIYKQSDSQFEVSLIPLDNNQATKLWFSALVVLVKQGNAYAYHTLVLEASGERIPAQMTQLNGLQLEITRLASDAYDAELRGVVAAAVKQKANSSNIFDAEASVLPRSFNYDDQRALHFVAVNAGIACANEIDSRQKSATPFNLANAEKDSTLVMNLAFNRQQLPDTYGSPVRSDVVVEFNSAQNQNQQGVYTSVNSAEKTVNISKLTGFVDLLYAPVAPQQNNFNAWNQQQRQTQTYMANFVVTDFVSPVKSSLAAQLLTLMTTSAVSENNNWIMAFKPVHTKGVDIYDIGALNIEANLQNDPSGFGQPIDTKSATFDATRDLGQYVAAIMRPGLVISLDVAECGPSTWYTSVFAAAAKGNPNAIAAILAAAETLCNNGFAKFFSNQPIFMTGENRVFLGSYEDENGQKRDVRDISYLAVANMCAKDPAVLADWSNTFTQTNYPMAQRLAARKRIIDNLTGGRVEYTGYAQRVTFNPKFFEALFLGARECGFSARISTPMSGDQFNNQRGTASFAEQAMMTNMNSGIFSSFGSSQAFNGGGSYFSRW